MTRGHDPSCAVDSHAHVALSCGSRLAGVEAHPHSDGHAVRPLVLRESALAGDRGGDRVPGPPEGDEERVALRVDLLPTCSRERFTQKPLVLCQDIAIAVPKLLEQLGRALDVRKEEGDGADGKLGHEQMLCGCGSS